MLRQVKSVEDDTVMSWRREEEEGRSRAEIYISSSCFSVTLVRGALFSTPPLSFAPLSPNLARVLFSHL